MVVAHRHGEPNPMLLSSSSLGQSNRSRVLQALADHGPLSRADLARMAGVPRASMGVVVAGLLNDGVLQEEQASPPAGRGKPARPVWFGPGAGDFLAVVVEPGTADLAVLNARGEIRARRRSTLRPDLSTDALDAQLRDLVTDFAAATVAGSLRCVGMALPAVASADGELVASTTIPALIGARLPGAVSAALGVPVVIEDDARALALGQRWFGQARGQRDFAALQIGDGIGAGIMLGGRLHRGPGWVSEIGHVTVDYEGQPCPCGLRGCWETIASLAWLRRQAEALGLPDAAVLTPASLVASLPDEQAHELLDRYADHVAVGIANLLHLLSIPLFILHGDVVGGGERLLAALRRQVAQRTMPGLDQPARIEFAASDEAAVLGAGAAAATFALGVAI